MTTDTRTPEQRTLDEISLMTADQLRTKLAEVDADLGALHVDDTGELRDLNRAEQDKFDKLMNLPALTPARHVAGPRITSRWVRGTSVEQPGR